MPHNNELPVRLPTRNSLSSISEGSQNSPQELSEKYKLNDDAKHDDLDGPAPPFVSNDVPIPAGILRTTTRARNGPHKVEDEEKALPQQTGIPEDFSILDIALEQRQHAEEALVNIETENDFAEHFARWDLESGNCRNQWESSNLATLEEGEQLGPRVSRQSARRSMPVRTLSNRSARLSRSMSNNSAACDITALPVIPRSDAVLCRSLDNYTLRDQSRTAGRPLSEVPPEADYVGIFDDPQAATTELSTPDTHLSMAKPPVDAEQSYIQNARKAALTRLCMRSDRNESLVGPAVQKVKQGAADLARRNSLIDVYDKAKIRGEQLQRKRWVQLTFEFSCYLLILCFIYFVLVGRPIWNGSIWWLYWLVEKKFTVAGTWSVTIGMAFFYAFAPLLILFEDEPPMPDESSRAEATPKQSVDNTALLIPCYKAAQLIGPTLAAALKIFPAKNIFVIANGNSPTPLDNTEEICQQYGVNHVWSPVGSKIVAQYVGCYSAKGFKNVLLIDDGCALPPNFPVVSDRLTDQIKCIGYTIKSVGPPENKRGTLCQQAQDLEYKISGLQRAFAGRIGSATFPHGAISIWDTKFLIDTFRTHPGFSVSEDWFFGHTARKLGSRVTMCTAVFVETETPSSVFFSSGSRGGFGEMTIFSQRFYRWNFFFVNGMFYNMAYILFSWKLGFWEIGAKLFVFQEFYETLLYLLAPFVLPISLIVRPLFCVYLLLGTLGMYYVNVTIFNEIHLRRRNERVGWVAVYLYYTPYKIVLTFVNVFSCYYSLYKYAKYFAKRHPKIIEDEKAVEVVLRLEESTPKKTEQGLGRRLTVTAVGSRLSRTATRTSRLSRNSRVSRNSRISRNSRASFGSTSIAISESVARPPLAHMNSRSSRRTATMYDNRLAPGSERLSNPFADLARIDTTDTIDFADEKRT